MNFTNVFQVLLSLENFKELYAQFKKYLNFCHGVLTYYHQIASSKILCFKFKWHRNDKLEHEIGKIKDIIVVNISCYLYQSSHRNFNSNLLTKTSIDVLNPFSLAFSQLSSLMLFPDHLSICYHRQLPWCFGCKGRSSKHNIGVVNIASSKITIGNKYPFFVAFRHQKQIFSVI